MRQNYLGAWFIIFFSIFFPQKFILSTFLYWILIGANVEIAVIEGRIY
jgi:hypothetical protein